MNRGKYIGSLEELKGETALIQPGVPGGTVLAQFDTMPLIHPETKQDLSHHWHEFVVGDFETIQEDGDGVD